MHICNYCGRYLKEEYEKCPGCGGSSFTNKAYLGEEIIEKPPEGGYKLDMSNLKKSKKTATIFIWVGIAIIVFSILFGIPFIFFGIDYVIFGIVPGAFIGILMIIIALSNRRNINRSIKRINKLVKTGILVKGMPYKLIDTGTMVMGHYYKCMEVKYKNSAGIEIPLYSETKYNDEEKKYDKTADLLIDPDDYSNYFIDFEIF